MSSGIILFMKSFILFVTLCFSDPSTITGINCLNAWEGSLEAYSEEECNAKGAELGYIIEQDLIKQNIPIISLSVYCIPKKGSVSVDNKSIYAIDNNIAKS